MPVNPQSNMAGILLMLAGMFLFTINDAIGKWLIADYSVGQLMAVRSFAALLILIPYLWRKGILRDVIKVKNPLLQLLRVAFVIAEVSLFYLAVRHLPLADVFMFYLASPIFVTALSVIVLRERVGALRWLAVLAGFVGVTLIFPPSGAALTLPALFALAGSLSLAAMMILARSLRDVGGFSLITYQTVGVALAGTVTLPFAWLTPGPIDMALLCLLGIVATVAHFILNKAVSVAPTSVVAPYQYTSIIWAMALGYMVWGDVPTSQALFGAALVIGAGLFILYRERKLQKADTEIFTDEVI